MPISLQMVSLTANPVTVDGPEVVEAFVVGSWLFPPNTVRVDAELVASSGAGAATSMTARLFTSSAWQEPMTGLAVSGTQVAVFPAVAGPVDDFSTSTTLLPPSANAIWKLTFETPANSMTIGYASLVLTPVIGSSTSGTSQSSAPDGYGVDLWYDLSAATGPDLVVDPGGDWLLVRGIECLRQSLIRRIITAPGDWRTLPDYGAGARLYVRKRNNKAARDELANRIRAQCLRDDRVLKCESVVVDSRDGMLRIRVKVVPRFLPVGSQGVVLSFGVS